MTIISLLSDICLLLGGIFTITGAVGLLRLPSFYTRLHAASVTESLAAPLLIVGIMLDTGFTLDAAKLVLIIVIMVVSNPTITHALCRAAVHGGTTPEMETKNTNKEQSQTETELSGKESK
ncbi:monovalent cation/H(+) antiporter subunit G [Arcobacter sp. LA11]|uniref:monovalent cation/H(+) antiporter subunit G n=1 Tax=Arcobacter sp. LA11 TaxID=1898176 RepID=UPI0009350118|nr:monovalent cation/H(+) antiporter subunit G [Arcobacter sp. LA11]